MGPKAMKPENLLQRFSRLAREAGWIVIGQVTSIAGALVLVRVLTEYLDPIEYGHLALGLTLAGLVNQVVMGGVTAGIGRFYSIAAEHHDICGYLHASRNLLIFATIAVVIIGLLLMAGLLWFGYSRWMGLAAAAILFAVLSGYNGVINSIQNAARQRAIVAFHSGLDAWLKILLAVGVMLWLGSNSTTVIIGYIFSSILVVTSQLVFLRHVIPDQPAQSAKRQSWLPKIWNYSWPFSMFGIFTWMQQASDRWALQTYATSADVGQYAVLFQLGYTPIAMAAGIAMNFLGPILYQRSGDATDLARNQHVHQLGWRITYLSLFITLLGFGIAFTLHEWFFRLLVAPEYRAISYLLPWVVLAGGLFAAGQMLALKLMSEMKSAVMTMAKIVTALAGVLFNVIGATIAGVEGVVCALVAFSVLYFIWMSLLGRQLSFKHR